MKKVFCMAALAASTMLAQAQQDFSKVDIVAQPLGGNLYMLTGAGGNLAASVGPEATFLVDDQFAPLTPKIKAALARIGKHPVRFVVNTHWHSDHTGGNENFAKAGSVIVAHENVRRRLSADQVVPFFNMQVKQSPPKALPVVTFTNDVTLHVNDDEMHVIHVPRAHTDSDSIVHFRRGNVLHMGDTFFNGMYPFIDVDNGGTLAGMIAAADRGLALANDSTRVIPGHGVLGDRAALLAYREMLVAVQLRLRQLVQEGRSDDEIVAARPTEPFDARYGNGFIPPERFVRLLLKDVRR